MIKNHKLRVGLLLMAIICGLTSANAQDNKFGAQFIVGWNYGFYTTGLSNLSTRLYELNDKRDANFSYQNNGTGFLWGVRWEFGSKQYKIFGDMMWQNMHRQFKSSMKDGNGNVIDAIYKPRLNALTFDIGFSVRGIGLGVGFGPGCFNVLDKRSEYGGVSIKDADWANQSDLGNPLKVIGADRFMFNVFLQADIWIFMFRAGYMGDSGKNNLANDQTKTNYYFNTNNFYINTAIRLGKRAEGKN
jgi:hypothetical protein